MYSPQQYSLGGYTPGEDTFGMNQSIFGSPQYQGNSGVSQGGSFFDNPTFKGLLDGAGGVGNLLGGIGDIASIFQGFQANKLAKEQLGFQKEAYKTNLRNNTKSYNTALTDRISSRYAQEDRDPNDAAKYIEQNKL